MSKFPTEIVGESRMKSWLNITDNLELYDQLKCSQAIKVIFRQPNQKIITRRQKLEQF